MATYGARYIKFAPISGDANAEELKYGQAVQLAELTRNTETINWLEAKQPGDDHVVESVRAFGTGQLAVEITHLTDENYAKVFGANISESNEVTSSSEDDPTYGGLGCIQTLYRGGKMLYKAFFYPKVKGVPPTEDFATKANDTITLGNRGLQFDLFEAANKTYRQFKTFDKETDAKAYVDGKFTEVSGG